MLISFGTIIAIASVTALYASAVYHLDRKKERDVSEHPYVDFSDNLEEVTWWTLATAERIRD